MNFDEFINKYTGKAIDYDGGYGVQCVDLIKLYLDKVFNLKIGAIGNAHAYYDKYNSVPILKNNFTRIANTPDFIPQKGDIAVWSKSMGGTGHVAICTGEGTTSYFYTYDMNLGTKPMKKVKHTYKQFLGVLRSNNQSVIINDNKGTIYRVICSKLNIRKSPAVLSNNKVGSSTTGTKFNILEKKQVNQYLWRTCNTRLGVY